MIFFHFSSSCPILIHYRSFASPFNSTLTLSISYGSPHMGQLGSFANEFYNASTLLGKPQPTQKTQFSLTICFPLATQKGILF